MKKEWRQCSWGDIATLEYGKSVSGYREGRGTVRVYGTNGPIGWHSESLCGHPGVVVGRKGAYRGIHYSDSPFYVIDTAFYLSPKEILDMRWAYYELLTHDINGMDSGSAIPSTSREDFYQLPVLVPSHEEQKAIANILGALDDKIENNRRMNETLEVMARATFKSWFVDFDPVRAKAEGRKPYGMDAATAKLFPDSFVDSPQSKIPKGWKICTFNDAIEIYSGGTPKTTVNEYWNGSIPWFSVRDTPMTGEVFVIDTEKKITQDGIDNSATHLLPKGTTIISARGTVGNIALTGSPMAMNQSCYGLRGIYHDKYYTYYSTFNLISLLKQHTHGSVFDTITRDTFKTVDFVLPPIEIISRYDKEVEPFMSRILVGLSQSRTLAEIRDTLLPKLMSGEIRIKDAEIFVEEKV